MKKLALLAIGLFHVACIDASASDDTGSARSATSATPATPNYGFETVYVRNGELAGFETRVTGLPEGTKSCPTFDGWGNGTGEPSE